MHIGHLLHVFLPETDSHSFTTLALKQAEKGNEVTIIAPHNGPHESKVLSENVTLELLPAFSWSMTDVVSYYPYIRGFSNFIKRKKLDIIHVHSHLFLTAIQAIVAAKGTSTAIITHIHGVMAKRSTFLNTAQILYLYTVGSWVFRNSSLLVCETKNDALEIMKYGAERRKIRIIPNAVEPNIYTSSGNNGKIIWTGRFVPEKGLAHLLESMEVVADARPNVILNLIGDGPLRASLERTVKRKGLNKNVHFLGVLHHDKVMKILTDSSIFVFPSLKEGCPRSLLEAMSCKKPAVVFDVDNVREIVQDNVNGRVVRSGDSEEFAKAIIDLIENPKTRERLGKCAMNTIIRKYSWGVILPKIEKTYEETLTITNS